MMKKVLFSIFLLAIGLSAVAQQRIQLRSADRAECTKSDMTSLQASFSFSTIEAENVNTQRGQFSWLSMPNTVIGGNEGDPQIPVVNELIAVPFGATPTIRVTGYSSTDYNLNELGIQTLVPRQPSLRKDQRPEDVPFVYNANAYQTRGLRSEPVASVFVDGTMRGIQVGKMTIEPVSYDPVSNTLRVFNNIEVEVSFNGANASATESELVRTYSPYFSVVYDQLFNGRMVRDVYSQHPDLYTTPVKMIVITTATYAKNTTFQDWVNWKKQKGIYTTVYTTATTGTSSSNIKTFIRNQYNSDAPTFVVVVGDTGDVTYSLSSSTTSKVTDLYYSSTDDSDLYPEMFYSRMPISSTTELTNLLNKILTYEQYTMADPSYLGNTLLIAGWDSSWTTKVGKPTIQYANTYYFNSSNGINPYVYLTSGSGQTTCYSNINNVGFANYTAHGSETGWADPSFSVSDVNSMTNNGKYLWAMGNCCLAANWGYSSTCFAEALLRAANKGAFGYIGSCPETYWYEDYYFGVGATTTFNTMPTMAQTATGCYDAMFDDTGFNTLNSVPFIGNIAVAYAHAGSYQSSVTDKYYWEAYHCLGDGSVMPYHTVPATNNVSHANTISIGTTSFAVSADNGSYVAITKNNEILGVAEVVSGNTVNVPITGLTAAGDVMIVVTRNQRKPYVATIQAVSANGPYITLDSYTPIAALVGQSTNLSMTFKNVGTAATSGTTTVTLSSTDSHVSFGTYTKTFNTLAANASTTVSGFSFTLNNGVTLGSNVTLHYTAVNGSNTWEGDFGITPDQIFTVTAIANNADYGTVEGGGQYHYGESCTVTATPADGYMFTSWTKNGTVVSTTAQYVFSVSSDMDLVANFAAGVMIGDGGSSSSEFLPSYNYYNYTLSEQIYTSAELGGAGIITSIAFYNEGAEKARSYDFYMKTTTKSSFSSTSDWIAVSAGDKVFSGSVTMTPNEWTTITLSTPFVYDGTSNVVLVADDNTGSWSSSPHMSCRVFTTTSEQALYVYNDNTNYNPSSPSSYSGTRLSTKNQIVLTKEPISTEPVYITVSANPAQAATVTGGGEYQFGQTCTVTATPNTGYTFSGWTENGNVVSTDLSYSFTAMADRTLVANFIQAIEIGENSSTNNYLPSYNYYNYSMTEQIYTAQEIGTAGTISSIAFYNGGAEKTRTYDFYLKATDKSAFSSKTDWVTVAASDKVFSGEVTMAANTWTFINFTTPFEYDGASNLVLVADDNTGDYTSSPHMACSVFNTSSTQAIYIYSDGTNYNPASPTTSQSSNYSTLSVKNHIMIGITASGTYTINATANPANAGVVNGAGTYEEGETCTLTATANTGYAFVNWTKNGTQVSTDATYTFTVTESATYVANFEAIPQYTITITPDDVEKGSVAFGRGNREDLTYDFEDGVQGWTLLKGTNGTSPNNWMHNTEYTPRDYSTGYGHNSDGFMLSESYVSTEQQSSGTAVYPDNYLVSPQVQLGGSITFWASNPNDEYGAEHFAVAVSSGNTNVNDFTQVQEWTLLAKAERTGGTRTIVDGTWYEYTADLSAFSGMGYIAIHHFDCYDQWLLCVDDVTITEPEEPIIDDGSVSRTFYEGESCTVIATPNNDYSFVNWTENGTTASSSATYTFTVTGDRELVANFSDGVVTVEQTFMLNDDWNWWSPSINITLADFEAALGSYGVSIISQEGASASVSTNGWGGTLQSLEVGKMYMVQTNGACTVTVNGTVADPAEYPINLSTGANWIGLVGTESMSLDEAFANFTPSNMDVIKTKNGTATYYQGRGWRGSISSIIPGQGFIYNSKSQQTFTFPSLGK